jgi:hypothetical protein
LKFAPIVFPAVLGLLFSMPQTASAQNFGGSVISSSHLSTQPYPSSPVQAFNDPTSALGQPTTLQDDTFGDLTHACIVNSAYGVDQTSGKNLLVGFDNSGLGELTVQMSAPITHSASHWFGQDFIVFGNTFFTGVDYVTDATDMNTYQITDSNPTGTLPQVSVSADGINFYNVAPASSLNFPENPYRWAGISSANPTGWGALNDFSKPVDPSLTAADFANKTVAFADNTLYNGSAGGTSYSFFGQTPLTTIDFIRFSPVSTGSLGIIDGVSAVGSAPVPEASTMTALLIGLLGLAATAYRRRKTSVIAAFAVIGLSVILPGSAYALSFTPQITQTVGTGSSESFITFDFQDGTTDHNYAFGYFYDGAKTGADMLTALTAGTSLNVGYYTGYGPTDPHGVFIKSFNLNGHAETGTNSDYWSYWLGSDGQKWKFSGVGASGRGLTNGSWDGWSWDANRANLAPLTPAAVPEPSAICLFSIGVIGIACLALRKRATRA